MSFKNTLLSFCALTAVVVSPAYAEVNFDIDIGVAPPPAQVEVVPTVAPGYFWVPGYWSWEDGRHVWVPGRRMEERPGYAWHAEHWVQRGDKWHFERGYWERRR